MPKKKIRVGISSCLLGHHVRYDGEDKRDDILIDAFDKYVEWVPICPEVEAGFSVPREAVHLRIPSSSPRIVTVSTGIDHTDQIVTQIKKIIHMLATQNICGFIFKSKSPSCGVRKIPIYNENGEHVKSSMGIFAQHCVKHLSLMPVADDVQLLGQNERKCFLDKMLRFSKDRLDLR